MPSSNENKRKKNKSPKPSFHHRKTSSSNMLEDFKGALRDELLSIDFTNDDGSM